MLVVLINIDKSMWVPIFTTCATYLSDLTIMIDFLAITNIVAFDFNHDGHI
jgi:hypothetical protein